MVFTSSASAKINVICVDTVGYNLFLCTSMADLKLNTEQFTPSFCPYFVGDISFADKF